MAGIFHVGTTEHKDQKKQGSNQRLVVGCQVDQQTTPPNIHRKCSTYETHHRRVTDWPKISSAHPSSEKSTTKISDHWLKVNNHE